MQTASSRIWTQVTIFIFYENNHYAVSASLVRANLCEGEWKNEHGHQKTRPRKKEKKKVPSAFMS